MKSNELTPIVFIPGLMGSIGGEMLGCKSGWGFGVASWFYKPFIKDLEQLGYTLNKNLFVCYYDWRKSCKEIVQEFLQPLILQIEEKHPNQKIDLLCHSMGGVVGRTYIQSKEYSYNIRNLMTWGTPNKGSIEAYYLWSTGRVMKSTDKEKELFEIIRSGYIWLLTKILDIPLGSENIRKLHNNFPGLKDLIPTDDYGYVLCYKDENNKYIYIPREYMIYNNDLVNDLNKNVEIIHSRIKKLYCFAGINNETDKTLIIDKKALFNYRKEHIIDSLKTKSGDGTVTVNSAIIDCGEIIILEESHGRILGKSIEYIANIYNLDKSLIKKDIVETKEYPLGIIFKKHMNMVLKNEKDIIGKFTNGKFITEYEFILEEFGKDYLWVMLKAMPGGECVLEVSIEDEEDYNVFIIGNKVEEELTYKNVLKKDKNRVEFPFKV